MEAIDRYLKRLAEPGMREYYRETYWVNKETASRPPASRRKVANIEKKLGIRLPPSYKKLVTTVGPYDGGYEMVWVEDLNGYGADIVSVHKSFPISFLLPMVPTLNGDCYCLDTRKADKRGEYPVVLYDHEMHSEESTEFEVASSDLGEFLLGCMPDTPPPKVIEFTTSATSPPVKPRLNWFQKLRVSVNRWRRERRRAKSGPSKKGAELTPLMEAARKNDLQKVSELLAAGADPNAVSRFDTPLREALAHKNREMAALLIEHGAGLRAHNMWQESQLQTAVNAGPEIAAWFFKRLPDPTVIDAAEGGTFDDVRTLVDAGGDVNMISQDERRFSPLQAAAMRGDLEMATFLVDRGADVNYHSPKNNPAIMYAATWDSRIKIVQLLLSRGADPNATNPRGETALYDIAGSSRFALLETLIRANADVNHHTADGSTPLHHAVVKARHDVQMLRTLVERGAKLDAQDNKGMTPLHAAIEHGQHEAAHALLDLGADARIRDKAGRTPDQAVTVTFREYPGIPEVIRRIREWTPPGDRETSSDGQAP